MSDDDHYDHDNFYDHDHVNYEFDDLDFYIDIVFYLYYLLVDFHVVLYLDLHVNDLNFHFELDFELDLQLELELHIHF